MPGPYLQAALLCERVLVEQDGTLSAIRLVDKIWVPTAPTVDEPAQEVLTILLSLKFGDLREPVKFDLVMEAPTGQRTYFGHSGPFPREQFPTGADPAAGLNVFGLTPLTFFQRGLHWIHVVLNGNELTQMPLIVEVGAPPLRQPAQPPQPPGGKS